MSLNPAAAPRINSIDVLRGLVMIIMALDHVRDFWGPTPYDPLDLTVTSPALYFTRWITHFCAPVFVFLAGTSAFLYQQNTGASKATLSKFLLTRGLWLVFIELTLITFSWQLGYNFIILQVIWAIGWSMVFLSALVFLPISVIAGIALVMIFGHNLLDPYKAADFGEYGMYWAMLHEGFQFYPGVVGSLGLFVGYPLIPWLGVMAAGFAFGRVLLLEPAKRDRLLVRGGVAMIIGFFVLRYLNVYGDLQPWTSQERGGLYTFLSFMDVEKYPPSLLFLLITLGPAIAIMPWMETWRGKFTDIVTVFGRVPFFYYVLHLPLINVTGSLFLISIYGSAGWWLQGPQAFPEEYVPSLLLVYVAWILTVAALYFPCRWYADYKRGNKRWYLSYL
ncbi:MAG: heparan-alpha-glucosaminide N-acetyltransferase domain-containing protein [Gammaproteobacteria bacterium]|nr:heparan-alpha-glucosaminide N-acetyltransferase domain-containing protein [Gammaproteobacteria bacterium]